MGEWWVVLELVDPFVCSVVALDCTLGEFHAALEHATVIEENELSASSLKELVLTADWKWPLHVVVIVDSERSEERIVTVYQPNPDYWSADYRRRR